MTRTLFPYDEDRHVIREFLHGREAISDWTEARVANGTVTLGTGMDSNHAVAFIDAQGALQITPPSGHQWGPLTRRLLNALLEMVQHEHRVHRSTDEVGMNPVTTLDGVELTPGVPMTILGPLGLRAWREANR